MISSLPEFSAFTGAAYIEQLKNKLLCEPSEAGGGIVEFRKESLSFSDNLNILTMQLSYSAAWFAYFVSWAPFLVKPERAPASLNS